MKWNLLLLPTALLTISIFQPTSVVCQDNPTKESQSGEQVYRIGNGVTAPRPIDQPMPVYDEKSRKAKVQGVVVLSLIVTKEGRTRDVQVTRSLSPGLDREAVRAVSQWRFDPATKDGAPVAVKMTVENSFGLGR